MQFVSISQFSSKALSVLGMSGSSQAYMHSNLYMSKVQQRQFSCWLQTCRLPSCTRPRQRTSTLGHHRGTGSRDGAGRSASHLHTLPTKAHSFYAYRVLSLSCARPSGSLCLSGGVHHAGPLELRRTPGPLPSHKPSHEPVTNPVTNTFID